MNKLRATFKFAFDVRKGEGLRTFFMSLYMLFILWAYYILKPISTAMFVDSFDIDKLPYLYMLIAVAGGLLGFYYTKLAVKSSLQTAVLWTTVASVACLVLIWWMLGRQQPWMLYMFNIWVSLFSIALVSQGWLVAANVFDPREAKRLYGLLGVSQVVGAFFGGSLVRFGSAHIGDVRNWLLASAGVVILSYLAFRCVLLQKGVNLANAKAADSEEANVSLVEILGELKSNRHLQLIMGIITLTFIVDTAVQYQFNVMAKAAYKGKDLAVFMATFTGIYTNLITFVLQFFLSAAVFTWLGVGGVLQIMPVGLGIMSLVSLAVPGIWAASANRLAETAMRYSLNKSAMELLYLPLPVELKNRTKAFVDIFIDRFGRGLGGMLIFFVTTFLGVKAAQVPAMTLLFCLLWIVMAWWAQKEYLRTVRGRLDKRRLDLESRRFTVTDAGTVALVEQAARSANARQSCYALSLLAEAPGYNALPLLRELVSSPLEDVRAKVYETARAAGKPELLSAALNEARTGGSARAVKPAVAYALAVAIAPEPLIAEFLDSPSSPVVEGCLEALAARPDLANAVNAGWLESAARGPDGQRRALAAQAIGVCGERSAGLLAPLLDDAETTVVAAACRAAGKLHSRSHVHLLAAKLAEPAVRAAAIEGLATYGTRVCGTLGDMLRDDTVPLAVRRQLPRVVKRIPDQHSVDVLLENVSSPDLVLRHHVLKGLNTLRETAPGLAFHEKVVSEQILNEARHYFQMHAALEPFRDVTGPRTPTGLLARTLEERLRLTIERLFRLLGLRYPLREMYASFLAIHRPRTAEYSAALEFLDNTLDRELKKIVMPMLDSEGPVTARGLALFGVEVPDAVTAVRDLIRCGDPWLVACASAAAADQKMRQLAPDIRAVAERDKENGEVAQVALAAAAALA